MENNRYRASHLFSKLTIATLFGIFLFVLVPIYCYRKWRKHRRIRQWNAQLNQPESEIPTAPPMPLETVATHDGDSDAPPAYSAVVQQRITAANVSNNYNSNPKVGERKTLETPPPAFITVAPLITQV